MTHVHVCGDCVSRISVSSVSLAVEILRKNDKASQVKCRQVKDHLPAFICAHIFIERETSGYEAGQRPFLSVSVFLGVVGKNPSMEDLPGSSLRTTVVHKTLKILPRGVNLCRRNAASMIALESAEWFDLQHNFLFRTEGQSTPSLLEYEVKQRDLHDNGRNTIKGGSRETKGQKSTGGGRTEYGKWEILTPRSPLTSFGIRTTSAPPDN